MKFNFTSNWFSKLTVVPVEQVDHAKRKMQETWTNVAEKRIILPLKCSDLHVRWFPTGRLVRSIYINL